MKTGRIWRHRPHGTSRSLSSVHLLGNDKSEKARERKAEGENTGISPLPPAEACHHKHRTGVSSHLLPVCSLLPQPKSTSPTGMPNWLVFHARWPTTGLSVFCTVPQRCLVGSTQWWLPCRAYLKNVQCICKDMNSLPKSRKLPC